MNLDKFLSLPQEHTLSFEDCQLLNKDLASKSVDSIPVDSRALVNEYLVSVLNMGSVEWDMKEALESLLVNLQNV
ncbi:hypothetical protein JQC92_13925 [Shewanella sp. 202IG2-18]|uniref:hypothetical protein n=1 Tax=Parashewanella hymeniacidonis TaxID=2807618 RepID=UPI00195F42C9|nr:hypothetical protein [Parashewanella hymeniacidonis]MBM7073112.1 hypothetical protein [Parashewanella hymeniacidonis]